MCRPWSRQVGGFLPIWSTNGHEQSDFRTKHFKTRVPKRRTFVPGRRCSRRARSVCVPTFLRSRPSGHYARYARENARCPKLAAKSLPNLDRHVSSKSPRRSASASAPHVSQLQSRRSTTVLRRSARPPRLLMPHRRSGGHSWNGRIIKTDSGAGVKVRACASSDGPPDGCWVRETA